MRKAVVIMQALITYAITNIIYRSMPWLKVGITRFQYNLVAKLYPHQGYKFINCGFAHLEDHATDRDFQRPEHLYVLWEQLYQRVAADVDCTNKDVLEIGCGRGGGSEYMMKTLRPRTLVAVDLSDVAIDRCKTVYDLKGLSFQIGNACDLPFSAPRFDVVVNVESSHCYPAQAAFFQEVHRVLKPGGYFCFADITNSSGHTAEIDRAFQELGLVQVQKENITANVIKSLRLFQERPLFRAAFKSWESSRKRNDMELPFMVIKNTLADLLAGKEYQRWVMHKPAS